MSEHSKLPPSSAARRVACPGSRMLEEPFRDAEPSPAAREGTAAHEIAALYLTNWQLAQGQKPIPTCASNGEPITKRMIEGAKVYLEAVSKAWNPRATLHIEERVEIMSIHPECWGTPDCWFFNEETNELHIFDYKYGHGYVEVFENWQLIEYAAGIMVTSGLHGIVIVFHIVQPRTPHPQGAHRTWRVGDDTLMPYFARLKVSEQEACNPRAFARVSPQCNNCLARHVCPSLRYATLETIDAVYMNTPERMTAEGVGGELRYLMRAKALLDARVEGLTQEATSLIRKGERVPYFTLAQSKGRLSWNVPIEQVLTMGELLNVDLGKPKEAITPRQAIEAGIVEELVEVYCERTRGALKLVPSDPQEVRKIFGGEK